MKCKKNIVFIFLMLLLGVVGVTYAYFTESESFQNNFVVSNFDVTIEEVYDPDFAVSNGDYYIPKEVYITNNEDVDAIIRFSFNENFETEDLPDYGDYKYLLNNFVQYDRYYFDWTDEYYDDFTGVDGWFYYYKVLPAHSSVKILNGVILERYFNVYRGNYNLDFNIEAVQATPEAVEEIWGWEVSIDESGNIVYLNFPEK